MKEKLEQLTIEEKIGQMLMVGIDTNDAINKVDDLILKYKVGGILLYKKNYKDYDEMLELINYIKKLNTANKVPIFIGIDQEGGRVNRMPQEFKNIPAANKLANYKEEDLVEKAGEVTAQMLSKVGINLDFAPVLDIKRFDDKHAIGDRAFSNNKEDVAKYGIKYMKKLQEQKIVPVIKHFPGHGLTTKDTHFLLPTIKEKMSQIEKEDMLPFGEAIKDGADAIMVGHFHIKDMDNGLPITMSRKFILKYIRKKYRYRGLIITDDMRMKSVKLLYGKNRAVKKAFLAGYDIILMKCDNDEKLIEKLIETTKKNPKQAIKINKSVERILKIKEKYNVNDEEIEKDEELVKDINSKINQIQNKIEEGR